MKKDTQDCASGCPIHVGMGIFGDRWTLVIIRDMMFRGKRFFGEFNTSEENIATNILADRLKRLEEHGIVSKRKDTENRSRYVYNLTPKGIDLMPVLFSVMEWVGSYYNNLDIPPDFLEEFRTDRTALEARLREKLVRTEGEGVV